MYRRLKSPATVQIELTEACVNKCRHCYNPQRLENRSKQNFPEDRVEQTVHALAREEVFHVVLTGGEPLLNRESLFRFADKISAAGLTFGVNSTLFNFSEKDAAHLKGMGILNVLTSLLGSTAEKHDALTGRCGSFEQTLGGIRVVLDADISLGVNMVITNHNIGDMKATAGLVKKLRVRSFYATRAACPSDQREFRDAMLSPDLFRKYLEELDLISREEDLKCGFLEAYPLCGMKDLKRYASFLGHRCLAGVTSMTLAADGSIRPCSHSDMEYGNVFVDNSISEAWGGMSEWPDGRLLPADCKACPLLSRCGGGCRMNAKTVNGSIGAMDPFASLPDVEYTINQLRASAEDKENPPINLPNKVKLRHGVRMRSEPFGGTVFYRGKIGALLNPGGMHTLEHLKKGAQTVDELTRLASSKEKAGKFLKKLLLKSIIEPT